MPRNLESFSEDSTLKDDVRIKMAAFRAANWQTIGGGTLLHAVTHPAPTPTSRIAAFDLDDTLIGKFSGKLMWPKVLPDELRRLVDDSFTIVVLSNQLFDGPSERAKESKFRQETPGRAAQLKVPFYIYAAKKRNYFRKPMPGMIEEHLKLYNDGKPLHPDSFFVGDAAGRPRDHSDSDRKMALSVPMTFFTPEEFFLKARTQTYTLSRFDMMSLSDPDQTPYNFVPSPNPEVVLLTGYPGSGKTLFSQQELQSRNYTRITDLKTPLEPNTSYAIELIDLVTAEGRKRAVAHARKSGLPVRLLQIEPPGGGPNGAWRQLVWEEHCLGRRIQAANPFAQNAGRTSKLIAKSFAETCQKASFPHPQSEEAAEFVNGVELVWWSYRGPLAQRERFFRVWAETGEEKNKDLKMCIAP